MLTHREREAIRRSLEHWPKGKGHLFMRTVVRAGRAITTEQDALFILQERPSTLRFASPEITLAAQRQRLSDAGIERAFRDLAAFCRSQGYIYLELLDHNPEFLASLLETKDAEACFGP